MAKRLIALVVLLSAIMGQSREILVDEENTPPKISTLHLEENEEYEDAGGVPCHMEYQVMKRVLGTCIKLGRGGRGCVAGNYLHPLHPECM